MGVGNKPKFHIAVLLLDVARVLAIRNGRTVQEELNTISGYNDDRKSHGWSNLSELDQISRFILGKFGRLYKASLRQQARQAKFIT
jgi:hypothetical protein